MESHTDTPSIVFLNGLGHVEITWSSRHEDRIRALIEKKMAEGIQFFILKPRILGLMKRPVRATAVSQIRDSVLIEDEDATKLGFDHSEIRIHDPDLADLAANNAIRFSRRDGNKTESIGIARTVQDVLSHRTAAVPRLIGG